MQLRNDQRNIVRSAPRKDQPEELISSKIRRRGTQFLEQFVVVDKTREPVTREKEDVARRCLTSRAINLELLRHSDSASDHIRALMFFRVRGIEHAGIDQILDQAV